MVKLSEIKKIFEVQRKYKYIIFLLGLLPFIWYLPNHFIAKGDYFPYIFNIEKLCDDFYLWSPNNLGEPSLMSAYSIFGLLWGISGQLNIEIGLFQIILQSVYLMFAGFSMYYLSQTVYPKNYFSAFIASIFYMFNFFILFIILNIGMRWTYSFLPLLLILFVKAITSQKRQYTIYFAITFSFVASISSMNVANLALIIISIGSFFIYFSFFSRKKRCRYILKKLVFLIPLTILLSVWWLVPVFNYYFISTSTVLQQDINVISWSWTHSRASFLNLFWLNGGWAWRQEYVPFFNFYNENGIFILLLFLPLLLATSALLFRDRKNPFNIFLLFSILSYMFLAKGLHEPLSSVNHLFYEYVPYMNMFREPVSKFTLLITIPLALLIGFSMEKIYTFLSSRTCMSKFSSSKLLIIGVVFMLSLPLFPIFINPIETKTDEIPYSSYVALPEYWYKASSWFNNKTGDYKILVTPIDDYYQVPYTWGYYGTDLFIERLIEKPIISPCHQFSYKVDPEKTSIFSQLDDIIKFNRSEEFQAALSLLNVKYILQRNDLDYQYLMSKDRVVLNPFEVKAFFSTIPNIKLIKTIEQLEIYEYLDPEPYLHIFKIQPYQNYKDALVTITSSIKNWNFSSTNQFYDWKIMTVEEQFGAICKLYLERDTLRFELLNSTWGWKTISSPLIPVQYDLDYLIKLSIKGENSHGVHFKVVEYNEKFEWLNSYFSINTEDGTFQWKNIEFVHRPQDTSTSYFQLQVWNGHETNKPTPNIIWLDDVEVIKLATMVNISRIETVMESSSNARILEYEKLTPTRIFVKINSSAPFILAINEAFNQNWKVNLDGETYSAIQIFSVMNGFQINKTGEVELLIEYEPQKWFSLGVIISALTLLICLGYLIFQYKPVSQMLNVIQEHVG